MSDLQSQLFDERVWGNRRGNDAPPEDKLYTSVHEASNSIIVVGQGDTMDLMLGLISDLDQERSDVTRKIVQTVPIKAGDPDAIAQIIRQAFQETDRGRWWMTTQAAVSVTVDRSRGLLIMVGEKAKVDQAVEYAQTLAATRVSRTDRSRSSSFGTPMPIACSGHCSSSSPSGPGPGASGRAT